MKCFRIWTKRFWREMKTAFLRVQCNILKKNLFFARNLIFKQCRTRNKNLWTEFAKLHSLASEEFFEQDFTQLEVSYFCYCFHSLGENFGTFTNENGRVVKLAIFNCSGVFSRRGSLVDKKIRFYQFSEIEQKSCETLCETLSASFP